MSTQGGIFKHIVYKINYNFLRYVRTICPKIFAKFDYFAIVSQKDVAYFTLRIF